jgi:CubicO group peptidase (beta-lactamase class C family)
MREPEAILPRTTAAFERGRETGLHAGAQFYVSRGGEVVADSALGEARPGVPMRRNTITPWLSAGKPITAVAIAQLAGKSLLTYDDPVSRFLPEFGQAGKQLITLRHLLTHTAGFREADRIPDNLTWDETIPRICATPLETGWVPGERAGYQLFSSWFILGEVVHRIGGYAYNSYARANVFQPLGMSDSWIGMPPEMFRHYGERIGFIHVTDPAGTRPHPTWNSESAAAVCRPGSNTRGPIRELGKFYEMLLRAVTGRPPLAGRPVVLSRESIRELTTRQRIGLYDQTFRHTMDWGLGFLINSNRHGTETVPYGYGRHASEETFGHSGSQSSCAFADPAHDLVVAWHCNGQPGEPRHQKRAREIHEAIYEDLGLVG